MLVRMDFTVGNLKKSRSHEPLVTGNIAYRVRSIMKFENIVFRSFTDNQFSHAAIVLADDPLIGIVSDVFVMRLISHPNELIRLIIRYSM